MVIMDIPLCIIAILQIFVPLIQSLQDPCSLCFCIRNVFKCNNFNLTTIPGLSPASSPFSTVDLVSNSLTTIHGNAFLGTNVSTIHLDKNKISIVDQGAFNGIESQLVNLSFRDNMLSVIPNTFKNLTKLRNLDLRQNPITVASFDGSVFRSLGQTLTELHFGHEVIKTWPESMSHLPKLKVLDIDGAGFSWIPINAFYTFRRTLKTLFLRNTQLTMLPQAISKLENIEELHFDGNIGVGDNGILASAFLNTDDDTSSPIRNLSLNNDSLTTFPPIFKKLENLEWLSLDDNKLWYISDTAIDLIKGSSLSHLSLSRCKLDRIPGSILKITNLTTLVLEDNNIVSIDVGDLYSHLYLKNLDLSGNPLKYISTKGLYHFPFLTSIDFSSTRLYQIPTAILNVPTLREIDMRNCSVECNCNLVWITHLMTSSNPPRIYGDCETIDDPIEDYLNNTIQLCPS